MGVSMAPTMPGGAARSALKLPLSTEAIEKAGDARDIAGIASPRMLLPLDACTICGKAGVICISGCSCSLSQVPQWGVSAYHRPERIRSMDGVCGFEVGTAGARAEPSHIGAFRVTGITSVGVKFGNSTATEDHTEANQRDATGEETMCPVLLRSTSALPNRLKLTTTASSDNDSTYSGNSSSSESTQSGTSSYGMSLGPSKGMTCTSPRAVSIGGLSRLRLQSSARDQDADFSGANGANCEPRPGTPPLKRKRPPKLVIPVSDSLPGPFTSRPAENEEEAVSEMTVEGAYYGVYCKRGRREVLEDAYQAIPEIEGDSSQAFFGVYDGHGGPKAAEYASKHLANNIIEAMAASGDHEGALEAAVRDGYLSTDRDFLGQDLPSGASCVTSIMKGGSLYVANAGDCRAVLSRVGVAEALTRDHRASREDEKRRIEDLGGLVVDCSGVWRVQNTLAVSRGIGDMNLKEYITAEPEVTTVPITSDCEFLILASDGLWDLVSNQEAVDIARPFLDLNHSGSSCGDHSTEVLHGLSEGALSRGDSGSSPRGAVGSLPRSGEGHGVHTPRQAGKARTPQNGQRGSMRGAGRLTSRGGAGTLTPRGSATLSSPLPSPREGSPQTRVRGSKRSCGQGWDTESRNSTEAQGEDQVPSDESGEEGECRRGGKDRGEKEVGSGSVPKFGPVAACKKLVDLAVRRGTPDDVSVVIIWLEKFHQVAGKTANGMAKGGPAAPLSRANSGIVSGARKFLLERSESGSGPHLCPDADIAADLRGPPKKRMSPNVNSPDSDMGQATIGRGDADS